MGSCLEEGQTYHENVHENEENQASFPSFQNVMDSSSGKYTGILCDAKQKNYKIKYLGRHEDGTESKSDE